LAVQTVLNGEIEEKAGISGLAAVGRAARRRCRKRWSTAQGGKEKSAMRRKGREKRLGVIAFVTMKHRKTVCRPGVVYQPVSGLYVGFKRGRIDQK